MSVLNWQVNSSSIFVSFFIVMTHDSPVNFKLIYFQLWTKDSHQSPKFETFKCSGENMQNSSRSFLNYKFVYLKILHHSLVSWKVTPLYFFRSDITGKDQSKYKFLRLLCAQIKIHQILVTFETKNPFFFKFCINLQCHETQLLCTFSAEIYVLSTKGAYLGTNLAKSKVWNLGFWWAPFLKII